MADSDFPTDLFEELDREIKLDGSPSNKRVAVRYRRTDIKAVVKILNPIFPRLVPVILQDISSKGAAVISNKKLTKKSRTCLYLLFDDGKRFAIDGKVVYCEAAPRYGLKFDTYNESLAEHLLHTQTDLVFG